MRPLEFNPPTSLEISRDRIWTSLMALSNLATQKGVPSENRVKLDAEISRLKNRASVACQHKKKFDVQEVMRPLNTLRVLDANGKSIDINISPQMENVEKNLTDMQKLLE